MFALQVHILPEWTGKRGRRSWRVSTSSTAIVLLVCLLLQTSSSLRLICRVFKWIAPHQKSSLSRLLQALQCPQCSGPVLHNTNQDSAECMECSTSVNTAHLHSQELSSQTMFTEGLRLLAEENLPGGCTAITVLSWKIITLACLMYL